MLTEQAILDELRRRPDLLPPLRFAVEMGQGPQAGPAGGAPDAVLATQWRDHQYRFAVEVKRLSTPKAIEQAMGQVRRYADSEQLRPMVVTPYLSPEQLANLEAASISGIDLCGNGVVIVPGQVLVYRTGQPNRYPASAMIRNVYRGTSSMVARVFLLQQSFDSVGEIRDAISRRGGKVSLSTVSKVLQALAEDLVVRREGKGSRLLQADTLLTRLASNYRRREPGRVERFRWRGEADEVGPCLAGAAQEAGIRFVTTGAASVAQYAVMPREKVRRFYCENLSALVERLPDKLVWTTRFEDVELQENRNPVVYFDQRIVDGAPYASIIQTWLELQTGDKREQDAAVQVRRRILDDLRITEQTSEK